MLEWPEGKYRYLLIMVEEPPCRMGRFLTVAIWAGVAEMGEEFWEKFKHDKELKESVIFNSIRLEYIIFFHFNAPGHPSS